jgi:deoxyribodipyrimidine photo-lyase
MCRQKYSDAEIKRVFFMNKEQINSKYSSKSSVKFFTNILKTKLTNVSIIQIKNLVEMIRYISNFAKQNSSLKTIAFHYDYTPYAIQRENAITEFAKKNNLNIISTHDQLLLLDFHTKKDNTEYSKFTPYYNTYPFNKIKTPTFLSFAKYTNYAKFRDVPSEDATTHLSHYLKFGVISPREAYTAFKNVEMLKRQLIWRDFYYTYYYFNGIKSYSGDVKNIPKWQNNDKLFKAWKNGKTGFPIVDAGMRQLKHENYMHNRVRMITANFLTKILQINWKKGELHFSENLIDIDRIQNMAGWHSVSSLSKHSLPYFRVFNPWIQSKKYDPDAKYIKKYIPELSEVQAKDIHAWETSHTNYPKINYPKPIVNYAKQKQIYLNSLKTKL